MNNSFVIGIIRESREDELRSPLIPKHVNKLKDSFPEIKIIVQPSDKRCFNNEEYKNAGASLDENLSTCNLILGVKEIDTKILIQKKKYLFFSHTSKIQEDNSLRTKPLFLPKATLPTNNDKLKKHSFTQEELLKITFDEIKCIFHLKNIPLSLKLNKIKSRNWAIERIIEEQFD